MIKNDSLSCNKGKTCIAVLLSLFNPNEHLDKQILSVINQNELCVHLFIRFDGGASLQEKIETILASHRRVFYIHGEHLGSKRSYLALLQIVLEQDFAFIAFCDQDDVWYQDKLHIGTQSLMQNQKALAYCANQDLEVHGVFKRAERINRNFFPYFENIARGCTLIIRPKIGQLILYMNEENIIQYDFAIYVMSEELNALIVDDRATMLYRVHKTNEIGLPGNTKRLLRSRLGLSRNINSKYVRQLREVLQVLAESDIGISSRALEFMYIINRKSTILSRLKYVLEIGHVRRKTLESAYFKILILLKRFA